MIQRWSNEIAYLAIIVVVGISSTGFFWYYSTEINKPTVVVEITKSMPMVLGVHEEMKLPIETALALETEEVKEVKEYSEKMLPSEINKIFNEFKNRDATFDELDSWVGKLQIDLENILR
ncbi:MAG: hypothetical protein ACNFW9_04885 [Candidatus Kerfeldbacteria bacterium]